ncbi:MAG: hypothetical protein ACRC35_11715 [Angustibacter sp.]
MPLRPLPLADLLDGAVQAMRHNPPVMFGLSAVVAVFSGLMSVVAVLSTAWLGGTTTSIDPLGTMVTASDLADVVLGFVGTVIAPFALRSLALTVLTGLLIIAVSEAVIGRRPSIAQVWQAIGWRGLGRLMLLTMITSLLYAAIITVLVAAVVGLYLVAIPLGVIGTVIAGVAAIGVVFLLWVRLAFAPASLLLERIGVGAALTRSWRLVTGSWWRVFGILLLAALIAAVASFTVGLPFSLLAGMTAIALGGQDPEAMGIGALVANTLISNLGTVLSTIVVAPFSAAMTSLLYIDVRIRREGLDVALGRAAWATHEERSARTVSGPWPGGVPPT